MCTRLDHIGNQGIRSELVVCSVSDEIRMHREEWSENVEGMPQAGLPKQG